MSSTRTRNGPSCRPLRGRHLLRARTAGPTPSANGDIAWQRGSDSDRQFLRKSHRTGDRSADPRAKAGELATELESDEIRSMLTTRTPKGPKPARVGGGAPPAPAPRAAAVPPAIAAADGRAGTGQRPAAGWPEEKSERRFPPEALPPPTVRMGDGEPATQEQPRYRRRRCARHLGAGSSPLLPLTGPDKSYGQRAR